MNPTERVRIGKTPLMLTRLGLGTAPLGGLFRATKEGQAIETVERAYALGLRSFDVAPWWRGDRSTTTLSARTVVCGDWMEVDSEAPEARGVVRVSPCEVVMGFFSSFKKGLQGAKAALGPGRYAAGGTQIACPHCGGDLFREGHALLVRRGMAFAESEWAGKGATTLACARCGRIEWFLGPKWLGPGDKS